MSVFSQLWQNTHALKYDSFSGCTKQVDIAFVLDVSGSVKNAYIRGLNLIKTIFHGLNHVSSRTRVAFLTYGDSVVTHFHLKTFTNYKDIENSLEVHKIGGSTETSLALRALYRNVFTISNGDRTGITNFAVFLTDGQSRDTQLTRREATNARVSTELFSVGIGDFNLLSELNDIASQPSNEHVFTMQDRTNLDTVANRILNVICRWRYSSKNSKWTTFIL